MAANSTYNVDQNPAGVAPRQLTLDNVNMAKTKTVSMSIAEFLKDPARAYAKVQSGKKLKLTSAAGSEIIVFPGTLADYGEPLTSPARRGKTSAIPISDLPRRRSTGRR